MDIPDKETQEEAPIGFEELGPGFEFGFKEPVHVYFEDPKGYCHAKTTGPFTVVKVEPEKVFVQFHHDGKPQQTHFLRSCFA